jgi:hypothetical protein
MMISRKIQRACISIRILVEAEADSVRLAKVKCGLVQLVCGKLVGYRRAPLSARFDNLAQDCGAMGMQPFCKHVNGLLLFDSAGHHFVYFHFDV